MTRAIGKKPENSRLQAASTAPSHGRGGEGAQQTAVGVPGTPSMTRNRPECAPLQERPQVTRCV